MMETIKERIAKLKETMKEYNIDGYIVPSTDEYQGEYPAPYAARLCYITNFSGSNGLTIITKNKGYFFTDGRYITQANGELDLNFFSIYDLAELKKLNQITGLDSKNKIGYDPILFTPNQLEIYKKFFNLIEIEKNLIDEAWEDQPPKPNNEAYLYPDIYAGRTFQEKLQTIRTIMQAKKAEYLLITTCESICWLLNIRGSDAGHTPLVQGYVILGLDKVHLFTNPKKISDKVLEHFGDILEVSAEENIKPFLKDIKGGIIADPATSPSKFYSLLQKSPHVSIIPASNIIAPFQAIKNEAEIKFAIEGHIKDAVALCEFFAWLEERITAKDQSLTEFLLAEKLYQYRMQQENFICGSFPTICGFQSNGAIIHYRPTKEHARHVSNNGMLLIDSGGQYYGCTTDVTRTIYIGGEPEKEHKARYTDVLKGHINLAMLKFSIGTNGAHIDAIARKDLWAKGLNYAHGTGHGVGSFLSVHEGPQRIAAFSNVPLEAGMIVSNEPGYYKVGKYGIRIENLVYIRPAPFEGFLEFANLTLVPYCKKLIDFGALSNEELEYLRSYYQTIREKVLPLLSSNAKSWVLKEIENI